MSELKIGDRVRLVYEGTYKSLGGDTRGVEPDGHADVFLYESHALAAAKSVEKIEPPVEQFGPGDVVRRQGNGKPMVLGPDGYTYMNTGNYYTYAGRAPDVKYAREDFTSGRFERVSLVEVPF